MGFGSVWSTDREGSLSSSFYRREGAWALGLGAGPWGEVL